MESVYLLYRSDAWMSTDSMELIGVFGMDDSGEESLSEAVRTELREIAHGDDFDPNEWNVRKLFGKWVKKDLEAAREQQIEQWLDYFFENDQTPTLRTNLNLEVWNLNEAVGQVY